MSVIINGMDMPKNCFECGLKFHGICPRLVKDVHGLRHERLWNCPLTPLGQEGENNVVLPYDTYHELLTTKAIKLEREVLLEKIKELIEENL